MLLIKLDTFQWKEEFPFDSVKSETIYGVFHGVWGMWAWPWKMDGYQGIFQKGRKMYINTGKHGYFQQILTVILLSKEWYVPQGIVGRGREQRKVATFLNSLWQIYYFSGSFWFYNSFIAGPSIFKNLIISSYSTLNVSIGFPALFDSLGL